MEARDLAETYPESFKCDISSIPEFEADTATFIAQMLDLNPMFEKIRETCSNWDTFRTLRVIYRSITCGRWAGEIETRLTALMSHIFGTQLLAFRYLIATDMIENELRETLKYDPDVVSNYLFNPGEESDKLRGAACVRAAEEEIARVELNAETEEKFLEAVFRFEDRIEAHISKATPNVLYEIITRLMMESMVASADALEPRIGLNDGEELGIAKEVLDSVAKTARRFTNERLGIKRGGKRATTKFVWNEDRKREFYQTVIKLVHKDGTSLWEFAYHELIEKGFSYRIIEWLRVETALRDVPDDLWKKAIKAWKGQANDFGRLGADETPQAYAMYHALVLLDFPKTAFSTMKKYFGQGKRLSVANKCA